MNMMLQTPSLQSNHEFLIYPPGMAAPDIYAFRYKIYEEEMERGDPYSDHEQRIITDDLDKCSYNIAAMRGGQIIGCVRVTFCADGDTEFYRDFFELDGVGDDYPEKVTFTTRLMVDPSVRRGTLPLLLCAECFKLAIRRKTVWSFLDCNQPLIPFFERISFDVVDPHKTHPVYGDVAIMRIDLREDRVYDSKTSLIARYIDERLVLD